MVHYRFLVLSFLISLAAVLMVISGCGQNLDRYKHKLTYRFDENSSYRVNASYESGTVLIKAHEGTVFSTDEETINVKSTYGMKAILLRPQVLKIEYYLRHISLNDNKGRVRIELGPENGRLTWYDDDKALEDYLGPEGFKQYVSYMEEPVATILINDRGEQLTEDEATGVKSEVRLTMLELLSKNRVMGKYIVKAFKIPPVLMTIFPEYPVNKGAKWIYRGTSMDGQDKWQQSLQTRFQYLKDENNTAIIAYQSNLDFTSEELNQLRGYLGIGALEKMEFKKGQFGINGEVAYNDKQGRPVKGRMDIIKSYGFMIKEEKWSFEEKEYHNFQVEEE